MFGASLIDRLLRLLRWRGGRPRSYLTGTPARSVPSRWGDGASWSPSGSASRPIRVRPRIGRLDQPAVVWNGATPDLGTAPYRRNGRIVAAA